MVEERVRRTTEKKARMGSSLLGGGVEDFWGFWLRKNVLWWSGVFAGDF
jgi:hypothetical protein